MSETASISDFDKYVEAGAAAMQKIVTQMGRNRFKGKKGRMAFRAVVDDAMGQIEQQQPEWFAALGNAEQQRLHDEILGRFKSL